MSDLRRAAQNVVAVWNRYQTVESLRGWMEILEDALNESEQDKFCDTHCTWRDHHPECVRAEQPKHNFCARCGKRLFDGIHTCTPP